MKVEEALQGASKVFLDTAPIVYYVEARAEFVPIVRPVFRLLDEGQFEGIASPVTLAECLVKPKQLGLLDLQQRFISFLTNTEGITLIMLGESVGILAAEMRSRYHLKLPDALQVATALETGCNRFLTNDIQLKRVTELNVLVMNELEA